MGLGSWLGAGAGLLTGGMVTGGLAGLGGAVAGDAADKAVTKGASPTVTGFDPTKDLGPDNALPGQNYFDKSVDTELIPGQEKRDFAKELNEGLDPNKGEIQGVQGRAGDNANDPMVQAINENARKETGQAVRGLVTTNQAAGAVAKANELSQIAHETNAEYQNQVQNFNQQYQYEMQRYQIYQQYQAQQAQAQASLWGSVFGGIGKIGGSVAGAAAAA